MQIARTQLKTGNRPTAPNTKTFKEGEILFKEGDKGRELFIIKEGEVRVSRGSGEAEVELARLPAGSILGEMSLLDSLPRSATVSATRPTVAAIINELLFNAVLAKVPPWLVSIIRIITSRIRDANKRVGQSILRNREAGVASLLNLMLPLHQKTIGSYLGLDIEFIILESYYTCRLGKSSTTSVLQGMQKRGILEIGKDTANKEVVFFKDPEILSLFVEYCKLKERGRSFSELEIPDAEVDILNNIAYVAQKSGRETKSGTELAMKELLEDLAQKNVQNIERLLANLQRRDVISIMPNIDGSDSNILFRKELLGRIRKIKEWNERFSTDISKPESEQVKK